MKHFVFDHSEFFPRSDCFVAAAILGAGALSAGASVYASSKAADAQTAAANSSIAAQREIYDANRELLLPYINTGTAMLPSLQGWADPSNASSPLSTLMKLVTPGADMSEVLSKTPGFQFSNTYGQKAIKNTLAARGLGGPGGALARGAADYAEGLAGNTWTNVVQQLLNTFNAGATAKQNIANLGENAGAAVAGVGQNTANSIGNAMIGAGNAQATNYNAIGSAVGGLGSSVASAAILNKLIGGGNGGSGGLFGSSTPMWANPANVTGTGLW